MLPAGSFRECTPNRFQQSKVVSTHPRQSPVRQLWRKSLLSLFGKGWGVCSKGVLKQPLKQPQSFSLASRWCCQNAVCAEQISSERSRWCRRFPEGAVGDHRKKLPVWFSNSTELKGITVLKNFPNSMESPKIPFKPVLFFVGIL